MRWTRANWQCRVSSPLLLEAEGCLRTTCFAHPYWHTRVLSGDVCRTLFQWQFLLWSCFVWLSWRVEALSSGWGAGGGFCPFFLFFVSIRAAGAVFLHVNGKISRLRKSLTGVRRKSALIVIFCVKKSHSPRIFDTLSAVMDLRCNCV